MYERFCTAYFDYANENCVAEMGDYLSDIVQNIRSFAGKKSLISLLLKVDDRKISSDPDYKLEVNFKTFIQKITRHHG